jgi:hypothetical protein
VPFGEPPSDVDLLNTSRFFKVRKEGMDEPGESLPEDLGDGLSWPLEEVLRECRGLGNDGRGVIIFGI